MNKTENKDSTTIPQYERIQIIKDRIMTPVKTLSKIAAFLRDFAEAIKTAPAIAGPSKPPAAVNALAVGIEKILLVTVE